MKQIIVAVLASVLLGGCAIAGKPLSLSAALTEDAVGGQSVTDNHEFTFYDKSGVAVAAVNYKDETVSVLTGSPKGRRITLIVGVGEPYDESSHFEQPPSGSYMRKLGSKRPEFYPEHWNFWNKTESGDFMISRSTLLTIPLVEALFAGETVYIEALTEDLETEHGLIRYENGLPNEIGLTQLFGSLDNYYLSLSDSAKEAGSPEREAYANWIAEQERIAEAKRREEVAKRREEEAKRREEEARRREEEARRREEEARRREEAARRRAEEAYEARRLEQMKKEILEYEYNQMKKQRQESGS